MAQEDIVKPLVAITGASSGIGEAIARRFSHAGHPLLLMARRVERMEMSRLPDTLCRALDVTDPDSMRTAIAEGEARYGQVDCLVNNAGTMMLGQVDAQDRAEWERMYAVNVLALLDGMASVLGSMRKRQSGTIVNVGSTSGHTAFPDHAAYTGTKFAVSGISENVRQDVAADGVRVVTISPGATQTEIMGHTTSARIRESYQQWKTEIGGVLDPDDVARAVLFAYQQPPNVCVREIVIAPTRQQR
jgi:NADP-dependent 3-hydroxy acid dehydrogenase YdfG